VGATPWKQQLMMMIGVVVAAITLPFVIDLLFNAYGIGGILPHPGMDPNQTLLAPQAGLMATVVEGLFTHQFNATMLAVGMVFGLIALLLNPFLRKKGFSIPILPLGIGIYLPISTTTPLIIGGFLSYYVKRAIDKRIKNDGPELRDAKEHKASQVGMLISCGMVAGASVMAVVLAIPFGIKGNADALRLIPENYDTLAEWLSAAVTIILILWFRKRVLKSVR
jgi:putative OPT family oligopeptide transporter